MTSLQRGHSLRLLHNGAEFFPALLAAIDASQTEVRLETYIFQFDASGAKVAQALMRAARRGVAVYLLMDGIGTPPVAEPWASDLRLAGVQWARFSPLGRWGLLIPSHWRRLHRKLCVVDGRLVFCGGINVMDDLRDVDGKVLEIPRLDFSLQVSGPLVADARASMVRLWQRVQLAHQFEQVPLEDLRLHTLRRTLKDAAGWAPSQRGVVAPSTGTALAALVLRDNLRNRQRIERAYRKALADARTEIVIANAYFLPGAKLRRALVLAARRGVRVRLLLQGRYENFMQYHAARPVYGKLLAAGVEIHEYHAGFLHAKVAVVDAHWATVGSSNLDPLSLLLAREANVVLEDAALAQALRARLLQVLEGGAVALDAATYARRDWRARFLDRLAFGLTRVLLFLIGSRY